MPLLIYLCLVSTLIKHFLNCDLKSKMGHGRLFPSLSGFQHDKKTNAVFILSASQDGPNLRNLAPRLTISSGSVSAITVFTW